MSRRRYLVALVIAQLVSSLGAADERSLAGLWSGTIAATDDAGAVDLEIELTRSSEGAWSGVAVGAGGSAERSPLASLSVDGDSIRFTLENLAGAPELSGTLSADAAEIVGAASIQPPPPPPATDLFLVPAQPGDEAWRLGEPTRVTDRDGYDNQPRFLPDGSAIVYTSIRDGQADVYRFDIASGSTSRLTETTESEYSPTPLPSGDGVSTVRVEADGTQRLWSFDLDGAHPRLLLPEVEPVGYHGWLDGNRLALFVLGTPPTLQLADVSTGAATVVADSIGRSIHVTPDGASVSFVHKASDEDWRLELLDLGQLTRRSVIATRPATEDFAWTPAGEILMADDSELYVVDPFDESPAWRRVADLSSHGIEGITRLDVSPDGRSLALVGTRAASGAPAEPERRSFRLRRVR